MPETLKPDLTNRSAWDRVVESQPFKDLMAIKRVFIIPAFLFFLAYYFLLPVLVGYAPRLMAMKVWGNVNLAYLFALSQFFMAWMIAGLYLRASDKFDRISKDILDKAADSDFTAGH